MTGWWFAVLEDAEAQPGGGGFGAVMGAAFFKRYTPLYKPTLRKQKQ